MGFIFNEHNKLIEYLGRLPYHWNDVGNVLLLLDGEIP